MNARNEPMQFRNNISWIIHRNGNAFPIFCRLLMGGAGLYILFFDRKRLQDPFLYLVIIVSALFLLPILIWNLNNNFIELYVPWQQGLFLWRGLQYCLIRKRNYWKFPL